MHAGPSLTTAWKLYLGSMSGILPSQSMPQLFLGSLLKPGLTQAVEHVGPVWNKMKLEFFSEAELECGGRGSGLRIRKL